MGELPSSAKQKYGDSVHNAMRLVDDEGYAFGIPKTDGKPAFMAYVYDPVLMDYVVMTQPYTGNIEIGTVIVPENNLAQIVYAEAPVDAFIERLTLVAIERAIGSLPIQRMKELQWTFQKDSIEIIVKDILTEALKYSIRTATDDVVQELKDETTRVA